MAIKGKPDIDSFLGGADRAERAAPQPGEPDKTSQRQKSFWLPVEICEQLRELAFRRSSGGKRVSETALVVEALRQFLDAQQ